MNEPPIEAGGPGQARMDSLNLDLLVAEGAEDTTVRPITESQRRALEKQGLIPPTPPPNPPAEKE